MKKFIITLALALSFFSNSFAEIVENKVKEEKNFGPWQVICKQDVMMDKTNCKAFTKFYDSLSTIHIQPNNKIANQVVLIVPKALDGTGTLVRIDRNEVIKSKKKTKDSYNVVPFSGKDQKNMFEQMKSGKNFYTRFTVKDKLNKEKEITIKISLAEFNKMLAFYTQKVGK